VQGSTRAVMSGTTVVARHDFLPFGEEIGAGTGLRTTGQGFGVTDKIRQRYGLTERDDATGLDHTWWRKYENASGRWTSPDPYLGSMSIAEPQSFNRYAYVQNDPVNFVDPDGLLWWSLWNSLFDDGYFVPASQQGWNQMFGLNPISFTFTHSEHIGDGYWLTQRTTITLWNFPQDPLLRKDDDIYMRIAPGLKQQQIASDRERNRKVCFESKKRDIDAARDKFRGGAGKRILTHAAIGGARGAIGGAIGGGAAGGAFFGVGAVPGAVLGGVVGGIFGAAGGVIVGGLVVEPARWFLYDNFDYNGALQQAKKYCDAQY